MNFSMAVTHTFLFILIIFNLLIIVTKITHQFHKGYFYTNIVDKTYRSH